MNSKWFDSPDFLRQKDPQIPQEKNPIEKEIEVSEKAVATNIGKQTEKVDTTDDITSGQGCQQMIQKCIQQNEELNISTDTDIQVQRMQREACPGGISYITKRSTRDRKLKNSEEVTLAGQRRIHQDRRKALCDRPNTGQKAP